MSISETRRPIRRGINHVSPEQLRRQKELANVAIDALAVARRISSLKDGRTRELDLFARASFGVSYREGLEAGNPNMSDLAKLLGRTSLGSETIKPAVIYRRNEVPVMGILSSLYEDAEQATDYVINMTVEDGNRAFWHRSMDVGFRPVVEQENGEIGLADDVLRVEMPQGYSWMEYGKPLNVVPAASTDPSWASIHPFCGAETSVGRRGLNLDQETGFIAKRSWLAEYIQLGSVLAEADLN